MHSNKGSNAINVKIIYRDGSPRHVREWSAEKPKDSGNKGLQILAAPKHLIPRYLGSLLTIECLEFERTELETRDLLERLFLQTLAVVCKRFLRDVSERRRVFYGDLWGLIQDENSKRARLEEDEKRKRESTVLASRWSRLRPLLKDIEKQNRIKIIDSESSARREIENLCEAERGKANRGNFLARIRALQHQRQNAQYELMSREASARAELLNLFTESVIRGAVNPLPSRDPLTLLKESEKENRANIDQKEAADRSSIYRQELSFLKCPQLKIPDLELRKKLSFERPESSTAFLPKKSITTVVFPIGLYSETAERPPEPRAAPGVPVPRQPADITEEEETKQLRRPLVLPEPHYLESIEGLDPEEAAQLPEENLIEETPSGGRSVPRNRPTTSSPPSTKKKSSIFVPFQPSPQRLLRPPTPALSPARPPRASANTSIE